MSRLRQAALRLGSEVSVIRGASSLFAFQVASALGLVLFYILVVRSNGATGNGQVSLLITAIGALTLLGAFGLGPVLVRGVASGTLTRAVVWRRLVFGAIAVTAPFALAFAVLSAKLMPSEHALFGRIAAAMMPLVVAGFNARYMVLARGDRTLYGLLHNGDKILMSLLTLIAYLTYQPLTVTAIMVIVLGSLAVVSAASIAAAVVGQSQEVENESESFAQTFRAGMHIWLGNVWQLVNYRLDLFIVVAFAGIEEAGYYALAVSLATMLQYPADAVGTALLPRICALPSPEARRLTLRATFIVGKLTLGGCLVACALAPLAFPAVFGTDFSRAVPSFFILVPGVVALVIPKVLGGGLIALGQESILSLSSMAGAVVTVAANLLLVPSLGGVGAAIASSVAYSTAAMLQIRRFRAVVPRDDGVRKTAQALMNS